MQTLLVIINWILVWLAGWYGWLFLLKKGINHITTYRIAGWYFLFLSIASFLLYHHHLQIFFSHIPMKLFPLYFLGTFFIGICGIYYFGQRIFDKKVLSSHFDKKILAAMMDYRFIFAKSCDILFQQLLFLSLITSLQDVLSHHGEVFLLSGLVFGLVHLPLLIIKYNTLAIYFVIASFFAGILFSFLIVSLPYGILYSYMLHWCFYLIVGLAYNMHIKRKIKTEFIGRE